MMTDRAQRTVWVGGLPPDIDEFGLGFHVGAVAPVEDVRILRRGLLGGRLAVVVLTCAHDVERVCAALDRKRLDGHPLRVVVPSPAEREARP